MIVVMTLANKPQYLPDALASLEAQTRRDFRHILQMDDGSRDWGGRYPPAVFLNETMKALDPDDYLCWLSDDDLLLPNFIEDLAGYLDAHPQAGCCYGGAEVVLMGADGATSHHQRLPPPELPEGTWPVYDFAWVPFRRIGSGQFMVRRSVLDLIAYPYVPEDSEPAIAGECDGWLLSKIAMVTDIPPIRSEVMISRITPLSAHWHPGDGQRVRADWRTAEKWGG